MKNSFPVFYFSGTGNTWWAALRIAEALQKKGFQSQAFSIEQITPEAAGELIRNSQGAGFGFPVYGSDAPRVFSEWLGRLPVQVEAKPALGFVTQMAWSGSGFNFLEKPMKAKGLHLRWTVELNMPNNICLPAFPIFPYHSDTEKFKKLLGKRESDIEALAGQIAAGIPRRQHNDLFSRASAWIQRGPFRLVHDLGRGLWSVDGGQCLGESCGRCARICPVGNIQMSAGKATHGKACVYCLRCFNYCPTYAVCYLGASNQKMEKKPPFRGPVPEFRPELVCQEDRGS